MDISEFSALKKLKRNTHRSRGFTLVEIVLAMGIASFGLIAVMGLIPVGLNTFRQAMDASVGTHIAQQVIGEVQQTDFSNLVGNHTTPFVLSSVGGESNGSTIRYFDDQGQERSSSAGAIYQVQTRVAPNTVPPSDSTTPEETQNGSGNLATITVQIAYNPANLSVKSESGTLLW